VFRVLLAEPLDDESQARLAARAEVIRPAGTDEAALCQALGDCDALIVRTHQPVTRTVLEAGPRLRVVGVAGVGVDNVDVAAAAERGVTVLHTPAASSDAVAEFTLALMLQLLRPAPRLAAAYRAGAYRAARAAAHGRELHGLTVGIVGLGRIGSRVGRICQAGFGATVLYNDIVDVRPAGFRARAVEERAIWSECDIVTLHVPLTEQTRRLVDPGVLSQFRPDAFLINTARGAVVDTPALVRSLQAGVIAGAALDVTEPEPLPPDHPLHTLPNCLLTPHVAARTTSGLRGMYAIVDDVLAWLEQHGASPREPASAGGSAT
jgi:phosphoglycerate dehydrogenase-like enzyme